MNTLSVRLRQRPLRIGWCIDVGDVDAFRRSARASFTMWGGRYNPIIPINDLTLADALIRLYRVDALFPASDTEATKTFIERYDYLPWPLSHDEIFVETTWGKRPALVDLSHPIAQLHNEYHRNNPTAETSIDLHEWDEADPLSDVFLCTYGAFPPAEDTGVDYRGMTTAQLLGQRHIIGNGAEMPVPHLGRMSIATLNKTHIQRHHAVQNHWDGAGFYVGHADDLDDLITFWNLRAADIALFFHDPRHSDRTATFRAFWTAEARKIPSWRRTEERVTLWHRQGRPIEDAATFGEGLTISGVDGTIWNGLNIAAPIMYFGETSVLAAVGESHGTTNISFALTDTPFLSGHGIEHQHYVLSVDPGIGLFGNERATLHVPFLPKLNEYYGRNCHYEWNGTRAEPDSLGLVTSTSTDSVTLSALDVTQLVGEVFRSVGIEASPSKAGRICSTLIQQMGGLGGCRPFKIAGVRRLIEDHRPDQSFSRSAAMQMILGQGNTRPLSEYQQLYIEQRPHGTGLTNDAVLSYLLDKGVFRAGLKFSCPNCQLDFWLTLDDAKSQLECEYCGHGFSAARQLRDKDWAFRRSGLFGRDDHQEGAIPVVLTLQQLRRMHQLSASFYTSALSLKPVTAQIPVCETDFAIVTERGRDHRIQVAIGECKTRQLITADDVGNLQAIADAFPPEQFDVYIVFARLTPFSDIEIDLIRPLNTEWKRRVILLTDRELEPYFIYERTSKEFDVSRTAVTFEDMAVATDRVFFQKLVRAP